MNWSHARRLSGALALLLATLGLPLLSQPAQGGAAVRIVGNRVPIDLQLRDEGGSVLRLGDLVVRPTILLFADYGEKTGAGGLASSLAGALGSLRMLPGRDYTVVAVGDDPTATTADATAAKTAALAAVGEPFPAAEWHFLVGGRQELAALAGALGFPLQGESGAVDASFGLAILSPKGQVVSFLPGAVVLPLDLGMSLMAASPYALRRAAASVLRFCLDYDEVNRHFALNILRVSGIVIFILIAAIVLYLELSSRRRRRRSRAGA